MTHIKKFLREMNLLLWYLKGKPLPPPGSYKRRELKKLRDRYHIEIFVETGTLYGETVSALKYQFMELYSIELNPTLYKKAVKRFINDKHIHIIHGDSGNELPALVSALNQPALFWLDAHFSGGETAKGMGDTPIEREIFCLLNDKRPHVIVIDDMRLFGKDPEYPSYNEFISQIKGMAEDRYNVVVINDLMRITPSETT